MKKLIITTIAAALLAAWPANAQIGIVAGVTSSASDIDTAVDDVENINQYHFGLTYKLALGGSLAIQPALIYNMKGTTIGNIREGSDAKVEYKTGYLELPVQVQLSLLNLGIVRAYGLAEPFVGYAITNEIKGLNEAVDDWENVKTRFEYGVGLGAGVEVLKRLQVAVKYFWNLGNLFGDQIKFKDITKEISSSKCDGIAASVVILF